MAELQARFDEHLDRYGENIQRPVANDGLMRPRAEADRLAEIQRIREEEHRRRDRAREREMRDAMLARQLQWELDLR